MSSNNNINRRLARLSANNGITNRVANMGTNVKNTVVQTATNVKNAVATTNPIYTVLFVTGLIVILALVYRWWSGEDERYVSKMNPLLVGAPIDAFKRKNRRGFRVPTPKEGLAFSYSMWIYVADWRYQYGEWKPIFVKGTDNQRAPGLWLYPKTNALHARISTTADPNEGCNIKNIPLQKWVHITYVLDNRSVDIYVNGKLERSCVLRGIPILNNNRVKVGADVDGKGFYGKMSKLHYFTRALEPSEVYDIYSNGPNMGSKYKVQFFQGGKFLRTKE